MGCVVVLFVHLLLLLLLLRMDLMFVHTVGTLIVPSTSDTLFVVLDSESVE